MTKSRPTRRARFCARKTGEAKAGHLEDCGSGGVDTIFEIGGQDSKFISIDHGVVVDFAMNEACAAGTGSFLEEQAERMGIQVKDEFAERAMASAAPARLGERCTVFMERDVTAWMQRGTSISDLAAGVAYSVVLNYLNRVVRGRKIGDVILFPRGNCVQRRGGSGLLANSGQGHHRSAAQRDHRRN
jgi:activator of 2-hydroxyglutaryl-CoA dehydratase